MPIDLKQLLAEKLAANHQRTLARSFVANFSASLGVELVQARVVVRPESDGVAAFHAVYVNGIGAGTRTRPTDFVFLACRTPEEVVHAVAHFGDRLDGQTGYFRPSGYFPRELASCRGGAAPVFEVNFGWARQHFALLHAAAGYHCGLTTRHGAAGIVTHVVCGYADRHADEKVYEVGYWGHEVGSSQ